MLIKLITILFLLFSLFPALSTISTPVHADQVDDIFSTVPEPSAINTIDPTGTPGHRIGTVISNILKIIFIAGSIALLFMIVWGAFQWITSGGEKEGIGKARARIMHAIIGLVILALSGVIITVLGEITGITFFSGT
jgi:hypothetical protein